MRACKKCLILKKETEFYKPPTKWKRGSCKDCDKKDALIRTKKWYLNNVSKKKEYDLVYKKRKDIVARNLFLWIKYRVKRQPAYKNRVFSIKRDELVEKAMRSDEYNKIYNNWVKSGYDRKLAPTIDRINNSIGYIIENIQFLSMIDNVNKFWDKDRKL